MAAGGENRHKEEGRSVLAMVWDVVITFKVMNPNASGGELRDGAIFSKGGAGAGKNACCR